MTVADRIKERQRITRRNNEDLAVAADVHVKTVSQWRSGKQRPTDDNLQAIAPVLETTFEWLRDGEVVVREAPSVAYGLPQAIRVWIQEFLTKLVRADVSEREVEEARRVLTSPEMHRAYVGSEPQQYSEDETLQGIQAHAVAIETVLRARGYEIPR